jgi:biotin carboxyl carrier protein
MQVKAETDRIINKLCFKDGDTVKQGDEILHTELMKMMMNIQAPVSGKIKYKVAVFDYVYAGMVMAEIE